MVELRKFPYPYTFGFSISSHVDEMTPAEFVDVHNFINTERMTNKGVGVGLDIADSFWFFSGANDNTITLFKNSQTLEKRLHGILIEKALQTGHIDTFHSIGDYNYSYPGKVLSRETIESLFTYLNSLGVKIHVQINHGDAYNIQNFGYSGDNPATNLYWSDLAVENGLKFNWGGSLPGLTDDLCGEIHTLGDGNKVFNFPMYVGAAQTYLSTLGQQINTAIQNKSTEKYMIAYTYFGRGGWTQQTIDGLRNLKTEYDNGTIWVTTASKLLMYNYVTKYLDYTVNGNIIIINHVNCPLAGGNYLPTLKELEGITFYDDHPENLSIVYAGETLTTTVNETDGVNKSISIPTTRLQPIQLPYKARRIEKDTISSNYNPLLTSQPQSMEVHIDRQAGDNQIQFLESGEIQITGRKNMFNHVELPLFHDKISISLELNPVTVLSSELAPIVAVYWNKNNWAGLRFNGNDNKLYSIRRVGGGSEITDELASFSQDTYYLINITTNNRYILFECDGNRVIFPTLTDKTPTRLIIGKGNGNIDNVNSLDQTLDLNIGEEEILIKNILIEKSTSHSSFKANCFAENCFEVGG